jgi:hypothetical protein
MTQFSLFGAEVVEPALEDLDGILLAGGQWVRSAGTARLSVVVVDSWRTDAIAAAFDVLGLGGEIVPAEVVGADQGLAVRTDFAADLLPYATRWTRGANQAPPAGFVLGVGGLRLWAVAAGQADPTGYLLGTDTQDDAVHLAGGSQLARLGLAATSVTTRSGPGWRVTSLKRLRRLGELLGERPPGSGADWPL